MTAEIVPPAFNAIGKGGAVVITGMGNLAETNIQLPGTVMTLLQEDRQGHAVRRRNPTYDIPKILGLYRRASSSSTS